MPLYSTPKINKLPKNEAKVPENTGWHESRAVADHQLPKNCAELTLGDIVSNTVAMWNAWSGTA